jgi:hypothetical protein
MAKRWSKKRKALVIALGGFAVSGLLYLWLPYRVAMVQLFFWLGGSRLLISAEYSPLDAPAYRPAAEVAEYADDAEVLGWELHGAAHAIPAQRIAWHLVVNDEIGGEPVVVTLCTVSDAALAYRARCGDRTLRFAPVRLARNNLVLRDAQTGSDWQQFTGRALDGPLAGTELQRVPLQRMRLADWRRAHPAGAIVKPAGTAQDCCAPNDACPVMSYFPTHPFLLQRPSHEDGRLPRKQPVVGMVFEDGAAVACPAEPSGCAPIEPASLLTLRCYWFAWVEFQPETRLSRRVP